jgi:hypothetical protein
MWALMYPKWLHFVDQSIFHMLLIKLKNQEKPDHSHFLYELINAKITEFSN